jgi:hypothetical protein
MNKKLLFMGVDRNYKCLYDNKTYKVGSTVKSDKIFCEDNFRYTLMFNAISDNCKYLIVTTPYIYDFDNHHVFCKEVAVVKELSVDEIMEEIFKLKDNSMFYINSITSLLRTYESSVNVSRIIDNVLENNENCKDEIKASNMYNLTLYFGEMERFNEIEDEIIRIEDPLFIFLLAHSQNADVKKLQTALFNCVHKNTSEYLYKFARFVKNSSVDVEYLFRSPNLNQNNSFYVAFKELVEEKKNGRV